MIVDIIAQSKFEWMELFDLSLILIYIYSYDVFQVIVQNMFKHQVHLLSNHEKFSHLHGQFLYYYIRFIYSTIVVYYILQNKGLFYSNLDVFWLPS